MKTFSFYREGGVRISSPNDGWEVKLEPPQVLDLLARNPGRGMVFIEGGGAHIHDGGFSLYLTADEYFDFKAKHAQAQELLRPGEVPDDAHLDG